MCTKQSPMAAVEESSVQTSLGPHACRQEHIAISVWEILASAHATSPHPTASHEQAWVSPKSSLWDPQPWGWKKSGASIDGFSDKRSKSRCYSTCICKSSCCVSFLGFFFFQEQFRCIKNKFYKNRWACLNASQILKAEFLFTRGGTVCNYTHRTSLNPALQISGCFIRALNIAIKLQTSKLLKWLTPSEVNNKCEVLRGSVF